MLNKGAKVLNKAAKVLNKGAKVLNYIFFVKVILNKENTFEVINKIIDIRVLGR